MRLTPSTLMAAMAEVNPFMEGAVGKAQYGFFCLAAAYFPKSLIVPAPTATIRSWTRLAARTCRTVSSVALMLPGRTNRA